MKIATAIITLVALMVGDAEARARIGETESECEARYGKPIASESKVFRWGKSNRYEFNGARVTICFQDGRASELTFNHVTKDQEKAIIAANAPMLGISASKLMATPSDADEIHGTRGNIVRIGDGRTMERTIHLSLTPSLAGEKAKQNRSAKGF